MSLTFQHRAVAQCDWEDGDEGCVITHEYKKDAESQRLPDFMEEARR